MSSVEGRRGRLRGVTPVARLHTRAHAHLPPRPAPNRARLPRAAARAVEGLTHDGVVLNVNRVEIAGARTLEMTGARVDTQPVGGTR